MRSSLEVLKYLDSLEADMLERPAMHASSPQSLEERLMDHETLRRVILTEGKLPFFTRYNDFLVENDCGSATFVGALIRDSKRTPSVGEQFAALVEFWRAYRRKYGYPYDVVDQTPRSPETRDEG